MGDVGYYPGERLEHDISHIRYIAHIMFRDRVAPYYWACENDVAGNISDSTEYSCCVYLSLPIFPFIFLSISLSIYRPISLAVCLFV